MMNEYERLKKSGYTEEEIRVELDRLSQINIKNKPLGPNREDRDVSVKDSQGIEKKTSSIMMGYNKKGIILSDGQYVSAKEFEETLNNELNSNDKDVVYASRKTGKLVKAADIAQEILNETVKKESSLNLSEDTKITNQDSAQISITDPKKQQEFKKGIIMLGNNNIKLPNGQYVSGQEIVSALNDYVKLTPTPTKTDIVVEKEDELLRVIKRIVQKFSWVPLLISAIITILSGLGFKKSVIKEMVQREQANLKHSTSHMQMMTDEEIKDMARDNVVKLKTGASVEIPAGTKYYSSSDHEQVKSSKSGTFGSVTRPEGTYNVDYISILHNGNIVHTEYDKGISVDETLEKVAKKLGVSKSELKMELHIGGPVAGWVNADELINNYTSESKKKVDANLKATEKQNGITTNFNGNTIIIDGNVTLKVVDQNGNLLPAGSIVIGSDGQKYRLDELQLETEKVMEEVAIGTKTKLNWSIHNISKEELLMAAAVGIVGTYLTSKKKKENAEMTETQIDIMISDVRKAFDDQSEFNKAVQNITMKNPVPYMSTSEQLKESLIDQEITVEDIINLKETGGMRR